MGSGFRILGELEILHNGNLVNLGTPRQRALLARLLISPNETARHMLHVDRLVVRSRAGSRSDARLRTQVLVLDCRIGASSGHRVQLTGGDRRGFREAAHSDRTEGLLLRSGLRTVSGQD